MKPAILPLDRSVEVYTPERCYITELANTPEDVAAQIALARVAPAVATLGDLDQDRAPRLGIGHGLGEDVEQFAGIELAMEEELVVMHLLPLVEADVRPVRSPDELPRCGVDQRPHEGNRIGETTGTARDA